MESFTLLRAVVENQLVQKPREYEVGSLGCHTVFHPQPVALVDPQPKDDR